MVSSAWTKVLCDRLGRKRARTCEQGLCQQKSPTRLERAGLDLMNNESHYSDHVQICFYFALLPTSADNLCKEYRR